MSDTDTLEKPKAKGTNQPAEPPMFTINRDALLAAIRTVGQVVEARNTIPILSNLLIDASDGAVRIRGTDLNIMGEVETPCDVARPLLATAGETALRSAIDTLRPGSVTISLADNGARLVIEQGRAVRRLPVLPATDFPPLVLDAVKAEFELPAAELRTLIESTSASMSTEEKTRVYLCGVFIHPDGKLLKAAATNGFGMVAAKVPLPAGATDMPGTIISRKTVGVLRRLLDGFDGAVTVRSEEKKIAFRIGGTTLLARTVEGTFPPYERVIPTTCDKMLKVHSAELRRCIAAAAALVDLKGGSRGVVLEVGRDGCQVRGSSPEGAVVDPLDGEFDDEDMAIGVNASLASPLVAIFGDAAQLEIKIERQGAPILFTSPDRPALTAVLQTMTV